MPAGPSTQQESLQEEEGRLQQELEELQKIKDLQRQIKEVRRRRQLLSSGLSSIGQARQTTPLGISGAVDNTTHRPILGDTSARTDSDIMELRYYRELDAPRDDSAERLLFHDMSFGQLYRYARDLEENRENNIKQVEQLSRVYCYIFSRTGRVSDIQSAIDRAEDAVSRTHDSDPEHAPFLKNLVVMIMKKYACTQSISDIDKAIEYAEQMEIITPPLHPDRENIMMDMAKMRWQKALKTDRFTHFEYGMLIVLLWSARGDSWERIQSRIRQITKLGPRPVSG